MKNVNFRATEQVIEQLEKIYSSKGGAAEKIVPGFLAIRQYTLHELKGMFSKEELASLIDAQNGVLLVNDYQPNKGVLRAHMEDFELYESGITRHKAKPNELYTKINKLTASQVYFLQDEIDFFWRGGYKDLNEFIKKIV